MEAIQERRSKRPLPPVYLVVALLSMIALHLLLPGLRLIGSPWRFIGLLPVAGGVLLNLLADGLFKRCGTEIKPFRESSTLVTEGPFRLSRNPMYLGGALILGGLAVLLGSLTPFAVIPIMVWLVTAHFIVHEEREMERQFRGPVQSIQAEGSSLAMIEAPSG